MNGFCSFYTSRMSDGSSGQGASESDANQETSSTNKDMEQVDSSHCSTPCTVEEEITTLRIPMFRPKLPFLAILQESGASGEVFTIKEIVQHVKNYIIKHQLFDPDNPVVVHCKNDKLGNIFQVDKFTVSEAVPLFLKNSTAVPDTCIKIRRQLVRRAAPGSHSAGSGASGSKQVDKPEEAAVSSAQTDATPTPLVTSTTPPERPWQEDGASSASSCSGPAGSASHKEHRKRKRDSDDSSGSSRRKRHTSFNFQYSDGADEVDGAPPFCVQFNMETGGGVADRGSQDNRIPRVEEDSISVQYDSDHFALEYELESSDHRSESEISSHDSTKDIVVMCRESDIEFWADYSDTEASSDVELTDADHWVCSSCSNKNIPYYRHCSKCWNLRPGWLPGPDTEPSTSAIPSTAMLSSMSQLVKSRQKKMLSSESSDEPLARHSQQHRPRPSSERSRRKIRVVSASSPERHSDSLPSEDEQPSGSQELGCRDDSGISSVPLPSSQETDGLSNVRTSGGSGRASSSTQAGKRSDMVTLGSDVCLVCASRPKTGCIIHGNSGHQVCCYRCAKRLKRKSLPCPVCRRPIQKVIENFVL